MPADPFTPTSSTARRSCADLVACLDSLPVGELEELPGSCPAAASSRWGLC
jgi:hypothetical protein